MGLKKITSDDLENTILNPLENYLSSFKSEYTKERYTRIFKGYMIDKQIESYSKLPADRKLTKEEYGKWKLDSDIERLEVSTNDPTNLCSSPLDEIRLKRMKEMRDKNVTKRQN